MAQLLGAWSTGLIFALLALGILVSFRIFRFSDLTVDGSFTLGAAVSALLLTQGTEPLLATHAAFGVGLLAGAATGILHTKFKLNPLLSGILVMTALYTINLRTMGKSNLPLSGSTTLISYVEAIAGQSRWQIFGWQASVNDLVVVLLSLVITAVVGVALYGFFRTEVGTAMRATGDNDQMIRALGVNVELMIIAGLALANGLVALAGSLYAQYQGYADVQMGIGMLVTGLASVIIGESLVGGQRHLGLAMIGAVMGSILYRLMVALVLRAGLDANDMKLITAVFLFFALITPDLLERLRRRFAATQRS